MTEYGVVQRSTMEGLAEQTRRLSGLTVEMTPKKAVEILESITPGSYDGTGYPMYDGSYDVKPSIEEQVLKTANKTMSKNVTIEPIPYAEVSNTSGGITATIG